ncbi:5' nucleotidase, deoxy (Pyrimidine), cytosolic type C protein (NT5C) [uncultured archaeon]|nr:5' nucleotidase, deoxy (Pyrimidine), cytosolic type C protein (NT5C) [uncultured archaeon]
MKIKIAADVDDVLLNFMEPFLSFYNSRSGTAFKRRDMFSYLLEQVFGEPREELEKKMNDFYFSNHFRNLPVVKGAKTALQKLNENYEVIIVTSRASTFYGLTEEALEQSFRGQYSAIFHSKDSYRKTGKTKAEICEEQKVSFLVEDCLKYAIECNSKRIPVFLMNAPWNQGDLEGTLITRVRNWKEILLNLKETELLRN